LPTRISQYTKPEGVRKPLPTTFVGALVFGAADFLAALCASANIAVNTRMIAMATTYLVMRVYFFLEAKS
jgi:hypothetical protein